ncbi:metalloregulator ArsR/SmtB family transcription factor [bacterium]|nr:metalloregulator ArsR/SmtB family transcription factor [bacterium]
MEMPTKDQCVDVSGLLKSFAHPQRLMILCQLADGPKNVTELEEASGASQSGVSQFLAKMKSQGLVDCKRYARSVYYEISNDSVLKLVQSMRQIF